MYFPVLPIRMNDWKDDKRINEVNHVRKEIQIIDLGLEQEGWIEEKIDKNTDLQWHPHAQIQRWDEPQLDDQFAIPAPFHGLLFHWAPLDEDTKIKNTAEDRNREQRRAVVEKQIDVHPYWIDVIARPYAQELSVVIDILAGTKKDRSEVEHQGVDEAEQNWTSVEEELVSRIVKKMRVKDEKMPFDTGEGHRKQIDSVQRILKPIPKGTEKVARRIHIRGEEIHLVQR